MYSNYRTYWLCSGCDGGHVVGSTCLIVCVVGYHYYGGEFHCSSGGWSAEPVKYGCSVRPAVTTLLPAPVLAASLPLSLSPFLPPDLVLPGNEQSKYLIYWCAASCGKRLLYHFPSVWW